MLVGLAQQRVLHRCVDHIGSCKFVAELIEFLQKSLRCIDSRSFGVGDLELVVDKHLYIVVERLRLYLLRYVFMVKILELAQVHVLAGYVHQNGICRLSGPHGCQGQPRDADGQKLLFHALYVVIVG